jgi:uncharacterized protein DUF3601
MKSSYRQIPCAAISLLLLVGVAATIFAFWLVDHRQVLPNSDVIIAALMVVFFVSFTWAFMNFLRWRDGRRAAGMAARSAPVVRADLQGTVYGMMPGNEYRVLQSFTDYYGNSFQRNELLRFKERHFLPYEGGHTIIFDGRTLYLQEDRNREILENFSQYLISTTNEGSNQPQG